MATGSPRAKAVVWIAVLLCIVFIGIQFIRPAIENPPVTAEIQAPPAVKQILRSSCYNCHSDETKLPWYDQVAPAYWLAERDVEKGRMALNFSEIGELSAAQQKGLLFEAINQIQLGVMPLPAYRAIHPGSAVTPEQLEILRAYLHPPAPKQAAPQAQVQAADAQYEAWQHAANAIPAVQPEPNGIAFIPDYKNWRVISSTDRFDNHTMREILGNEIAIKAIAEHRINPWPDGTVFAKVAWAQQPDAQGISHTGAFVQVELMIRDQKKYAATKGWGWGRWRGADLKPYGRDASFAHECVDCHKPVRKNDYVYTAPLAGQGTGGQQ
ncbi:heme-binding domain-containing protein [Paracidobacterium acidisoli]|uniref:Cytochrome P460 n=1 Tax=Paracidobacterium acidisoli TaxID=2303751 RepID=A0A372INF5_9BACT|nr:heme-binding domain-containing protein [Paracidobacterium acidisoli]MBT9332079.1 heme-binding domain-containing protein [Paracidobacterium acidisoli]